MSEAESPRSALPYAPHCTIPAPCPQPRPTATAAPPFEESVIHLDGSVTGSGEGG